MGFKNSAEKSKLQLFLASVNYKFLIGIILLIIGITLFIFSVHATQQIAEANNLSQSISDAFEHNPSWNPLITFFGGEAQEKIDYYSHRVFMVQIGAVVLTALGAVMIVLFRKKKQNKL
jgi:cbb3-type cytochrome oxidase subunit 3